MIMPTTMRWLSPLERTSREDILSVQFKKLKYQLEYLHHSNPFYRRKFEEAGVKPEKIRSRKDFSERVPLVDKKEFLADQEKNPPFGERLGVAPNKLRQLHLTSGTSGLGQEVYGGTRRDMETFGRGWMNLLHWVGLETGDIALSVMPMANLAAGLASFQGMIKLGLLPFLSFGTDSMSKLESMKRFRPHYFTATTAYTLRLTILAKKIGLNPRRDLPNLKGISIGGEAYPISLIHELEEFWDTRIHESYGSTQAGGVCAFTCEYGAVRDGRRGAMHLLEPYYYTEVINPETLKPVEPGEEGEAVITTLSREASPVVRFRSRDKVRYFPHTYCPCGRPFDVWEPGNVSRYDDMMKIKASNVWPSMVDNVLFACSEVEEYAGRVWIDGEGNERVTVRLAFKSSVSFSPEEKARFLETRARASRANRRLHGSNRRSPQRVANLRI